jgi:hypothetical protein
MLNEKKSWLQPWLNDAKCKTMGVESKKLDEDRCVDPFRCMYNNAAM